MSMQQLPLPLAAAEQSTSHYFVEHSGVAPAARQILAAIEDLRSDPSRFFAFVISGPAGSGKSFFAQHFKFLTCEFSEGEVASEVVQLGTGGLSASKFVTVYESVKKRGGLLLIELGELTSCSPEDLPHVESRVKSAQPLRVDFPSDDELPAVVKSMAAQQNLSLGEDSVRAIISQVQRDLRSIASVIRAASEKSLLEQRGAGPRLVREVIRPAPRSD